MKKTSLKSALLAALVVCCLLANKLRADDAAGPYKVAETWKIGGEGRWDYVTADSGTGMLYVTRSTHTQVIDTASGKVAADIAGGQGLHGVALMPELGRGFISDGKSGAVIIFDMKTNAVLGTIKAAEDADCIIYDAPSKHVLAFCGEAGVMVPIAADVDPKNGKAEAAVDLGGSPEYAVSDGQGKVFVNINDKNEVAEIDTKNMKHVERSVQVDKDGFIEKETGFMNMKVIAHWPLGKGEKPTGMAMDAANRRLFIGCRNKLMVVMNADDGTIMANLPIGAGVDATAFDKGVALASCGDGTLTVVKEESADKFTVVQVLKTQAGARTMAVDAKTGNVYLPTADFAAASTTNPARGRPTPLPDTFKILEVTRP